MTGPGRLGDGQFMPRPWGGRAAFWRSLRGRVLLVTVGLLTANPKPTVAAQAWPAGSPPAAAAEPRAFRAEVDAFAKDLIASGYQPVREARLVAYHAVREARQRGIPPALVFGVMKQETDNFDVTARSKAGARGLMQIMPMWLMSLSRHFGRDLDNPIVNVRYGVYVLAHFAKEHRGDWERTLQGYRGNATRYATKVMRHVRGSGHHLCAQQTLDECVGLSLWANFRHATPSTRRSRMVRPASGWPRREAVALSRGAHPAAPDDLEPTARSVVSTRSPDR
jgi:hypothetical protein